MYPKTITFQLATHYLSKVALRIECLYQTISQACNETHPIIHHYALKNLLEILIIIEKPELKSRFLKELIRIEHSLNKLPSAVLSKHAVNLNNQIQALSHLSGPFGEGMLQDSLLHIFRSSQDCETYPPPLLYWLESEPSLRQRNLSLWLSNLKTLYLSVHMYLKLLRNTAEFSSIVTNSGFYQQTLTSGSSGQLILVQMDKALGLIPRMQLGHHGLTVRLCEASTLQEVKNSPVSFELAICSL